MKPLFIICLCTICFFQVKGQNNQTSSKKIIVYKVKIYDRNHNKIEGLLEKISDSSIKILGNNHFFSFAQIEKIKFRRIASTGRGMMYGALIVGSTGGLLGLADGNDPKNDFLSTTAGEKAAAGLLAGALVGAMIGGVVGGLSNQSFLINGDYQRFNFMKVEMDRKVFR